MTKRSCWWYRGGLASLALSAWVATESYGQAQTLRPGQPSPTRTSGSGSSTTRTTVGGTNFVNNNTGGFNGGAYTVPNYSRTSFMAPFGGPVTTGYNPNYPGNNTFVPNSPFNPYVNPYQTPYSNPYVPYNPYLSQYSPYQYSSLPYSPYQFSPYQYSPYQFSPYQSPYLGPYSGFYNPYQFSPYGLNQTGNPYGNFGPYDPFGNAFGGGMGYGAQRPY